MLRVVQRAVSLAGPRFLGGLPGGVAAELELAVGHGFTVTRHWRGGASNCYLLEFGGGRPRLVLKVPYAPSAFERELAAFSLPGMETLARRAVVPRLVTVFADQSGYLAEFIPGAHMDAAVRSRSLAEIAAQLASALRDFHAVTGAAFGDFHARNVLVRSEDMTLIDPAFPAAETLLRDSSPLVADLAMWTAMSCALWPLHLGRRPRWAAKAIPFNAELLARALAGQPDAVDSLEEVTSLAHRCLHTWMPTSGAVRNRIAYRPALAAVSLVERQTRSRMAAGRGQTVGARPL